MSRPGPDHPDHWERELAAFRGHLRTGQAASYRSWQPTKWQSLESLRDRLLATCWGGRPGAGSSAFELGCGSATLLLQLRQRGIRCRGLDRNEHALQLAREAAASLGVPPPDFIAGDFFDPGVVAGFPRSDLVLHIGVIEHLDPARQMELLLLSARLSHRWVLIGVPHEDGPVFSGFLAAVTSRGELYDDPHQLCDIPALIRQAGYGLEYADGLHLFYSSPDYYTPGHPKLDDLYARLRDRLVATGGERYAAFPQLEFGVDDIPVLRAVENSLTREERYANGFLRYYIVDTLADSVVGRAMDDPRREFARLRAQGTVAYDPASRTHYVLGDDAVRALSRDPRLRARGLPGGLADLPPARQAVIRPVEEFLSKWLAFSDPPKQAWIRRALAPCLTRDVMAADLAGLAPLATALADGLGARGGDLVADFAVPLSRYTTARVLNAESADVHALAEASSALIDYLSAPGFDENRARPAGLAIERLRDIVLRRIMPRGGRVATALDALRSSRPEVSDDDLVAAFAQLLTGAMEPLSSSVVTAVVAAASSGAAAAGIPDLIEESLSRDPPFHFAPRVAAVEFTLDGHRIRSGERIVLNLLQANAEMAARCPRATPPGHLSFGHGTHYCLGAAVSRLHLETVLTAALGAGLPGRVATDRVLRGRLFGATAYLTAPMTK